MKECYPLHGIVTVLNTPFTKEDQVDFQALGSNVENALKAGVSGFLVPAMASEVQKLSHAEKLNMVAKVLEVVDGAVPVFAGTADVDIEGSGRMIKAYQKLGCQHFLIQFPFKREDQFKEDFMRLMNNAPEVVMLQDWDPGGYGLSDDLILELFESTPAFRCLKVETVPAGVKYSNILRKTNGRLNVSGGWAVSQMPEALERGVHAFMPTGMHQIYTRIFSDFKEGKIDLSKALFNEILPVLAFSNQHLDISIHFFKRLLWKQGVYPTPKVREPITDFDTTHQKIADELIDFVIKKEGQIQGLM